MKHSEKVIIYDEVKTRNNIVRFLESTKCAATTSRVNDTTRLQLIKSVGMDGFVLFHYYVGRQNVPDFLFLDVAASKALATPERRIANIRRKLIKAKWFLQYNEYFDKRTSEYVIRTILGMGNVLNHLDRKKGRYPVPTCAGGFREPVCEDKGGACDTR